MVWQNIQISFRFHNIKTFSSCLFQQIKYMLLEGFRDSQWGKTKSSPCATPLPQVYLFQPWSYKVKKRNCDLTPWSENKKMLINFKQLNYLFWEASVDTSQLLAVPTTTSSHMSNTHLLVIGVGTASLHKPVTLFSTCNLAIIMFTTIYDNCVWAINRVMMTKEHFQVPVSWNTSYHNTAGVKTEAQWLFWYKECLYRL